jgi:uncharacterized protein (DUF305 family)
VIYPQRTAVAGCLLALLLGASACDAGTASAPPPAASSAASSFFGGTDLAWVEINIAMNEELLPLLDLVPAHSTDPEVKALVTEVRAVNDQELATLRALHDEAKLPAENPHKGMPMPGMMTPELVAEAAKVRGPAFDKLLLAHLEAHFDQGVRLAGSEEKSGLEPRTKALAGEVIGTRKKYLPKVAG